jgi:undecaprenyl-diphosphatase
LAFWEAIVLGIIQGLTEFLPVSSSGHLALAQYFFNIREPQLLFDIMLHVGTLGAVVVVFQRDIRDIFAALFGREPGRKDTGLKTQDPRRKTVESRSPRRDVLSPESYHVHRITKSYGRRFALLIIVGMVPTVIIALTLSKFVEALFVMPLFVSGMLIVTGIVLWSSSRFSSTSPRSLNLISALIIGAAQGIAAIPGISRSGTTISAALMRGVDREEAARYSLLLSVPAIIGAVILELKDLSSVDVPVWTVVGGTLTAFVVGYLAIRFLLRTLRKGRFSRFAYYCWGIGVIAILGYLVG